MKQKDKNKNYPSFNNEMLTQCCFNVGPASQTVVQQTILGGCVMFAGMMSKINLKKLNFLV